MYRTLRPFLFTDMVTIAGAFRKRCESPLSLLSSSLISLIRLADYHSSQNTISQLSNQMSLFSKVEDRIFECKYRHPLSHLINVGARERPIMVDKHASAPLLKSTIYLFVYRISAQLRFRRDTPLTCAV